MIGRSRLGKPRDRAEAVSSFIFVAHAIRRRMTQSSLMTSTDMLVRHSPWDVLVTWLLLASSAPLSEPLLLAPLLRDMVFIVVRMFGL